MQRSNAVLAVAVLVAAGVVAASFLGLFDREGDVPSFEAQACSLPSEYLLRTQRGFFEPRSGQIAILPEEPAYMASGGGGWSHSGPWPYLQDVPLVFYGPGLIEARGEVERPVTTADIAPTLMTMLRGFFRTPDGDSLDEVVRFSGRMLRGPRPRLILTIVLDGGGWNTLRQWPDAWPNLARFVEGGVSFKTATVGSSPSVTPAVHTTLGAGVFPSTHGVTGVPVRDEKGVVVDAFLKGESSRFIQVPTLAERWDEQNDNEALIGMVGYEPWHLGMIGKGAETEGGDKDHAAWLDVDTNEWITNDAYYDLPESLPATEGLEDDIAELDEADGEIDRAWRGHQILDSPDRVEETPAFVKYHARAMMNMIVDEGYGDDAITDLLFTNFKQIDRVGHYFNMASEEVRDALEETDAQIGELVSFLDEEVGEGAWAVVVTADHGQQPDAAAIDGYGIDPREVEADIRDEFGPVVRAVWPTEVFLLDGQMEARGVTVEEIARFLGDYRLADNTQRPDMLVAGAGRFHSQDRLFSMAIPAAMLPGLECR
ncbi:MAG TPA: alkaline phosphatase family protein [Actinomycetota bacterium]|nr:alkaline phosphatase family protein [Actinomycetota bacterium]